MIILFVRLMLLCWLALCGLAAHADTAPVLVVEDAGDRLEIAPWLDRLPSQFSTLSSAQLLTQADKWPWQALEQPVLAQGYLTEGIWLRLKIRNDGLEHRRIIELARANLAYIQIMTHQYHNNWRIQRAGSAEQSAHGDITGLGYSFNLVIPEGQSVVYLHLKSEYPIATSIHLSTENGLFRAFQNSAGFFGAGLALLGGMVIGLASLRTAHITITARWTFALIIVMATMYAMLDRGILGYWWLDVPGSLHSITQLSSCMLSIAHILLCRQFLMMRAPLTAGIKLLPLMVLANLVGMLFSVISLPNPWILLADMLRWSSLIAILAALWTPACNHFNGTKLYFAVMATGLISQLWNDAAMRGLFPFVVEPYQTLILWHLFALPILLHLLEQRPINKQPYLASEASQQRGLIKTLAFSTKLSPTSIAAPRILIVEDNPWVQQVLAGLLLKLNCQTCLAGDGQEALQRLESEEFDLVLMDCDLPKLDGFSTAQLWRTQRSRTAGASSPELPIIAITAHISASHRLQAKEAGMDDFLQKPIDMRTLHDVLTRWLPQYATKP